MVLDESLWFLVLHDHNWIQRKDWFQYLTNQELEFIEYKSESYVHAQHEVSGNLCREFKSKFITTIRWLKHFIISQATPQWTSLSRSAFYGLSE